MLMRWLIEFFLTGGKIMSRLDELEREVAEAKATMAAAAVTIGTLAERITACECDPFKLSALVADLNESQEALQSVVNAHADPVDPEPEPVEPDPEPIVPVEEPVDLEPDTVD